MTPGLTVVTAALAVLLSGLWPLIPGLVLVGLALTARRARLGSDPVQLAALCWGIVAIAIALFADLLWPAPPAIGLLAGGLWWFRAGRQPDIDWIRPGMHDKTSQLLALALTPTTAAALAVVVLADFVDVNATSEQISGQPRWLLALAGLAFIAVNPIVEEVLFRGLLQTSVSSTFVGPAGGIIIQGVTFGAIHWRGIPGGVLGVVMASAWGIALGIIRHRTGSIRIPWAVHVVANIVIFASVVAVSS